MKKRTLWYLFDRYLGHFLREKLTLDQLSVDIIDGKGHINDIALDVSSLNEELSFLPFQFVDGCFIDEISVYVPWSSLLTESCGLQIKGSTFICHLNAKDNDKNMGESDYLSRSFMSSSMQLAEEIVHDVEEDKFEGLEIFAQLIDSVLRRIEVIATDTTFILRKNTSSTSTTTTTSHSYSSQNSPTSSTSENHSSPQENVKDLKKQPSNEIKMKVKYLKCEENSNLENDGSAKNEDVNMAPRMISKRLTVENIQLFVGDACVFVLKDRHVMEIKVKGNKCDIQVYLSSILVATIKSMQIDALIDLFTPSKEVESCQIKGAKKMSSSDYARIEEQLQIDFATFKLPNRVPVQAYQTSRKDSSNMYLNDAKFLPLSEACNNDLLSCSSDGPDAKRLFCTIKFPGVALCLLNSSYPDEYNGIHVHSKTQDIETINAQLNELITIPHIRFIAMPLQIDMTHDSIKLMICDFSIVENNHRGIYNILSMDLGDTIHQRSVNFQCDIDRQKVKLSLKKDTNLILDPTLLERLDSYYKPGDSKNSSDFKIICECDSIDADFLFPVADLREESCSIPTALHHEKMKFCAQQLMFQTNLLTYELTMDRLSATLIDDEGSVHEIGTILSSRSETAKLSIKRGPNASVTLDSDLANHALAATEMDESIYISSTDKPEKISPFETKRKVIKSTKDDDEQVISPKDRQASLKYFEICQSLTQLQIEIVAPIVDLFIENKAIMDTLYNRFSNDLALWYPLSKLKSSSYQLPLNASSILNPITNKPQTYFTCRSGLAESMDSESSFHSAEGSVNHRMQNSCTSIICADHLKIRFGPSSSFHLIDCNDVSIGMVIGLEEETTNVISLHGNNIAWDYDDQPIITSNSFVESKSLLNLTVELHRKEQESKKIKFALQLADALILKTDFSVFTNFWNYINVTSESVPGYVPLRTLTELHINVINGGIVHDQPSSSRPVLITLDGAYITAMVVENTRETLFRFIIEESALYFKKNSLSNDSIKNYVCVVDSGLIDLYMKLTDEGNINFRASNNIINIRACSDSLNALSNLAASFVSNSNTNSSFEDDLPPYSPSNLVCNSELESDKENLLNEDLVGEVQRKVLNKQIVEEPLRAKSSSPMEDSDFESFWILGDDDIGTGIKATAEPSIRVLVDEPIKVIENYFGVTKSRPLPELLESISERYLLEEMTLVVNLYGGKDFEDDPEEEDEKEKGKFSENYRRSNEPKVHFVDNSIHLWESLDLRSAPNFFNNDAYFSNLPSNFKLMGGRYRQNDVCVQFSLSKIKSVFDKFKDSCLTSWRFIFMVNEIEIRDRVSKSIINKMLYEYTSENMPRRHSANMVYIKATTLKNPTDNHEECDLRVSVKPLRINIDQDTIMFLVDFFNQVKSFSNPSSDTVARDGSPPSYENAENIDPDQFNNFDSSPPRSEVLTIMQSEPSSSKPSGLFVKSFLFSPDVPIRLDYHGKRVDFEQVSKKLSSNLYCITIFTLFIYLGSLAWIAHGTCSSESK